MTVPSPGRDLIALTLAIGICTALNAMTVGVLVAAWHRGDYQLSENATQILTGWGGGIIGILGAVFGYSAGKSAATPDAPEHVTRADNPEP